MENGCIIYFCLFYIYSVVYLYKSITYWWTENVNNKKKNYLYELYNLVTEWAQLDNPKLQYNYSFNNMIY